MTQRLYYDNPYLTEFSAAVTRILPCEDGGSVIYLDKSAFYPTSGGQPFDTGTIAGLAVTDVFVDDEGDVGHRVDGLLSVGDNVQCRIDWERRLDHMQQHCGDHILAGRMYHNLGGHTIGLHIGKESSSIDVELPGGRMNLTSEEIDLLEDEVNERIRADLPIRCWFPEPDELVKLPLRKPPTVTEHIRIVQIGEDEFCACGGTHPSSTGQLGVFKIVDARPSRGKIRMTFVCGRRAFEYLRFCHKTVSSLTAILNSEPSSLPDAALAQIKKAKDLEAELSRERSAQAVREIRAELDKLPDDGEKVLLHIFEAVPAEALTDAANAALSRPHTCVLLGNRTEGGVQVLFARTADMQADMGKLLKQTAARFGGKGGGKPDFARGSVPDAAALDYALSEIASV